MTALDEDADITWEVAPHGVRFLNCLTDVFGMQLLSTAVLSILRRYGIAPPLPEQPTYEYFLYWVILWGMAVQIIYYFLFEALTYRTPGKMLTGSRVMTPDGEDPTTGQILLRTLVRLVPFESFSFLGMLNNGWHDRWSGTCVVRVAVEPSDDEE